ncbi:hypothetical protein NCAS_0A09470 [Naumovozyma castellii]|uniref:Protein kinase domain-containing protein n=1 Tax=Naumovozyma castellii TaxID=27288 RepID=G0V7Q7_NAUCA|nr:hypothetical protein NCAS_0A09470 [Naumovozyma castellii CBS 4309]CCC67505.1 hypothetical protein NCAS_0A09470 [Naumovozyma castellii CBS 4309]
MPFLRKITGNGTHSRSGSNSSIKLNNQNTPQQSTTKHPLPKISSRKNLSGDYRDSVVSNGSAISHDFKTNSSMPSSNVSTPNYDTKSNITSPIFQNNSSEENHLIGSTSSTMSGITMISESQKNDSRKSSGGSTNSLSFDKLILSWDPTDPDEWTMQRVISWFKFHEFPDTWMNFFRRHQLYGHNFIKLLAYENFAIIERFLPQNKNGSYTRFQHLLKKTMTKNVNNTHHIRQKSLEKSKSSRSSSDSIKLKNKSQDENQSSSSSSSRSASESALTPTKSGPSFKTETTPLSTTRTHQKTKSASSLYRRSFISLRGSSSSNSSNHTKSPSSNIKLYIPSRPESISELNNGNINSSSSTPNKNTTPPKSPSYPGLFKRHQKSNSSESSLLNTLFGTSNTNNSTPKEIANSSNLSNYTTSNSSRSSASSNSNHRHSASCESLSKIRGIESSSPSLLRQSSTFHEEKGTIWEKLKRRSQVMSQHPTVSSSLSIPSPSPTMSANSSITTLTPNGGNISPTPLSTPNTKLIPSQKPIPSKTPKKLNTSASTTNTNNNSNNNIIKDTVNVSKPPIDRMFFPQKKLDEKSDVEKRYILVTKDNVSFIPINIGPIKSLDKLRDLIMLKLNLSNTNFAMHMTDFNHDIGITIPDSVLETFTNYGFNDTTGKFFIKDLNKLPKRRSRAATVSSENHFRSLKSKSSAGSMASSMVTNNDEASIATSSSDITSFDDFASANGRRYPQTPSYYYDAVSNNANASNNNSNGTNEELNYWNYKDHAVLEEKVGGASKLQTKTAPKFNLILPEKNIIPKLPSSSSDKKGTFQILRKEEASEIDFNKRRESPYSKPELAPKREAPKPPTNVSPQRVLSISSQSSTIPGTLRRTTTKIYRNGKVKRREPPIISTSADSVSPSNEHIVTSYTPGSTNVLVPQPYKGANPDVPRKVKSDDDTVLNPISAFMNKQRVNRSNSTISTSNSIFHSPSPLLKRGSTRRIVSSTSAADVFEENDITFADVPSLSDSDGNDDNDTSSSDDIIWASKKPSVSEDRPEPPSNDDMVLKPIKSEDNDKIERKMTLRPSPEVVYQNLEKFFPSADLDKPVVEGMASPTSPRSIDHNIFQTTNSDTPRSSAPTSPIAHSKPTLSESPTDTLKNPSLRNNVLKLPRRTKTIRTIAHEASEKRKKSIKLKRQNTKMWGTRTVEVTEKQLVSINKSRNSKGEYKEFAWMKGEMIGKGSFGAVYLCLNVTTGEMMAVKQVEVPKYSSQDEAIISTVEALRSEVSTLKDLDHLNIVQYLGFENKDNIYSLFLEYVAGGSVGSLIRMYGRFDEPLIRHLNTQVLRGLAYLHSRGILHRDMKADNLLLDQDGVCKISDFGISRKSKDIYSNSDMTMRGTVFWMAPEMVDTKQGYSAKVDIWSLGCIVLEMFAGKRPWSNYEVVAAMFKIGKSKSAPPIPPDTLPLISQNGRDFLDACFEIDPDNRPTADNLLSHPFSAVDPYFDFKTTKLASFIKSNDKINSTKLRVISQEKK